MDSIEVSDFNCFENTKNIIYNHNNIGFKVEFTTYIREDSSIRYTCEISCCINPTRNECYCDEYHSDHDLDENDFCIHSYSHYSFIWSLISFKECVEKMILLISNISRCNNCDKVFKVYEQSDKVCCECILQRLVDSKQKSLGICSCCNDPIYKRNLNKLKCKHIFHKNCINRVTNNQCPLCRAPITSMVVSPLPRDVLPLPINPELVRTTRPPGVLLRNIIRNSETRLPQNISE